MEVVERQPPQPDSRDAAALAVIANRQRLQRRENTNRAITQAVWKANQ